MEKESTNLEQGDRRITGIEVNDNLPQELLKKTAELEMEENQQPKRHRIPNLNEVRTH
jgi:hypothetical protein